MKFNYKARTKENETKGGIIEASSRDGAVSLLQKYGYYVTFLEQVDERPVLTRKISFLERVSRKEILNNNYKIISYCQSIIKDYDFVIVSVISPYKETRKRAKRYLAKSI